jgi:hypothetical protein
MQLSKNKKFQYLFFFIISIYTIFNGGNSDTSIQINFILISLLFLYCIKDKNYNLHFKNFYTKNKISIIIYLFFLFYLIFQMIPLPIEFLKLFSPTKYNIINNLEIESSYSSISVVPSNTFFQIINFISMLILVFILKMTFYNQRHKNRLYLFLSFFGFLSSFIAITFYFNGNPDFFIFKNSYYKYSSTGFFINRTVFAIFLLFCLISSLELLKNFNIKSTQKKDNFFLKIYIRLFVIFITVGIITSFSRIGNFLLLITILCYSINEFFFRKSENKNFRYIILLIIFFDILIMGLYFGGSHLFDRFYLLREEFGEISNTTINLTRFQIIQFGLHELNNYLFFGYGLGGFKTLFQLNFIDLGSSYANHVHSDIVEFVGELGLIGFFLIIISTLSFFFNKENHSFINLILILCLIVILLFDFSLHIPVIQFLFITFLILNKKII